MPLKLYTQDTDLKEDVSEFTEPLSLSKLVLHDSGMFLKLYNADTYLKTKYQADEPDTEFVQIVSSWIRHLVLVGCVILEHL